MSTSHAGHARRTRSAGATLIEFALILPVFFTFFLGVIDFARLLWTWNAAAESTRWGARSAVVCDRGAAVVLTNMQKFLPRLTSSNVQIDWYDDTGAVSTSCDAASCAGVQVRITSFNFTWISPIGFLARPVIALPGFTTYLPREMMGQDANSSAVCT